MQNELHYRRVLADVRKIGKGIVRLTGQTFDQMKADLTYLANRSGMQIECKRGKEDRVLIVHINREKRKKFDFSELHNVGDTKSFEVEYEREAYFRSRASAYARSRGFSSQVTRAEPGHLTLTLLATHSPDDRRHQQDQVRRPLSKQKYPFATLDVGQSALIEVPSTDHQKVRGSAYAWARRYGWTLTCAMEPTGIRVTRTA